MTESCVSYFEVHVAPLPTVYRDSEAEADACIAIGVASSAFPLEGRQPGWDLTSYGYHSDDGRIFHGSGTRSQPFGPRYEPGDVVGCGVCLGSRQIFYTLNGRFLGVAFIAKPQHLPLHPVVGLDSHACVHFNFGHQRPFAFDLCTLPVTMLRSRPKATEPVSSFTSRVAHSFAQLQLRPSPASPPSADGGHFVW